MTKQPIADYITYLLAQAHRQLHLQLEERLQREGVQVEHWRILDILSHEKGLSMGALADKVLMNHPTLTKMIDKMVANGLIHRLPDPHDQRRVLVHITAQGNTLYHRLRIEADAHARTIKTTFGNDKTNELKAMLEELVSKTA